MRKFLSTCLLGALLSSTALAAATGSLQDVKEDLSETWAGTGAQDATFNAVSLSMLGWGTGLALGIGIIASAINQSTSSHESSSCSH